MVTTTARPSARSTALKIIFTTMVLVLVSWRVGHDYAKTQLRVLNQMMSGLDFSELWAEENMPSANTPILKKFERYFKTVAAALPNRADAYVLAGYCADKLNHPDEALRLYTKADTLGPRLAVVQYNIGALYFRKGDFTHAVQYLHNAMAVPVEINALHARNSKIYLDLLTHVPAPAPDERLKQTYMNANRLSIIAQRLIELNSSSVPNVDPSWTSPRIF